MSTDAPSAIATMSLPITAHSPPRDSISRQRSSVKAIMTLGKRGLHLVLGVQSLLYLREKA